MTFDEAISLLFRVPHAEFVTERKRLAAEVKAGGDKEGGGRLAKLARPPLSAWSVNQLWREDRADFDALITTARQVREGDFKATAAHKATLARLRARAATVLTASGYAATEATLRKVETSLSAIAVNGGFEPDLPGALTDDRDPPGFASMGIMAAAPGAPVALGPSAAAGEEAVRAQVAAAAQALAEAAGRAQAEIDAHTRTSALARAEAEKKQAQVLADAARLQGRDVPAANTNPTQAAPVKSEPDDDTGAGDERDDEKTDGDEPDGDDSAAAQTPGELVREIVYQMKDAGKSLAETFTALEGNAAGWVAIMKAIVEIFAISLVEAREAFEQQYASVTAFENPEPRNLAPAPRAKPAVALVPPPDPSAPLPPPMKPNVPGEKTTDAEKTFVKRQVAQWAERVSKLSADLETARASLAAAQQKLDGME